MNFYPEVERVTSCARGRSPKRPYLHVLPVSGNSCGGTPKKRQLLWALLLGSLCGSGEESPHPEPPGMPNWSDIWPTLTVCLDIISLCLYWRHTADTWSNKAPVVTLHAWVDIISQCFIEQRHLSGRSSPIDGPNLRSWQEHILLVHVYLLTRIHCFDKAVWQKWPDS